MPVNFIGTEKHLKYFKWEAAGYDEISPKVLKHAASYLIKPLTYIINHTLKTGIFPDKLKHAKVIPIHKSRNKHEVINYRPISIQLAISKVFEKIISTRLINYLKSNGLLLKD